MRTFYLGSGLINNPYVFSPTLKKIYGQKFFAEIAAKETPRVAEPDQFSGWVLVFSQLLEWQQVVACRPDSRIRREKKLTNT